MLKTRVIPCLLLKNQGLVKTVKFKDPKYVGDPINAVKIFNEKEVDELVFLDIAATISDRKPNFKLIAEIASECFMPFGYGGGIRNLRDIRELFNLGVEKVIINSYGAEYPQFIKQASDLYGGQSIVVSIDVKRNPGGKYEVYTRSGTKNTKLDPVQCAVQMQKMGSGELLLNSIDRDGTMAGYDIELLRMVSEVVTIPVVACGGAGKLQDFYEAVNKGGAAAVAAGSLFVLHGKYRAVLISYPSGTELDSIFELNAKRQ
jgi:cyclase